MCVCVCVEEEGVLYEYIEFFFVMGGIAINFMAEC